MKVIGLDEANLEQCIRAARRDGVVLTRKGMPVALLLSVRGLDLEQIELGQSDAFWTLIRQRRGQRTLSRGELEKRLADQTGPSA